ncbi:hypothetical protein, partial [Paenibacillus macerans]|uniref:hypothetical protein n=1 Tax=Paenibacillus macerans TaxID=44252 RepID=UPI00227FFF6A
TVREGPKSLLPFGFPQIELTREVLRRSLGALPAGFAYFVLGTLFSPSGYVLLLVLQGYLKTRCRHCCFHVHPGSYGEDCRLSPFGHALLMALLRG